MASTGEAWRLGRRPALDGLRGIAILLVVIGHAFPEHFVAAGSVGVGIFFTLSGFLITRLLLEERERSGRVSLAGFWARRARRLLPALALYLVAVAVVMAHDLRDLLLVACYLGNLPLIWGHGNGFTGQMWSLAVEEHFYLVFPLLFVAARSRRTLSLLLVATAATSVLLRLLLWQHGAGSARVYFGTDTNVFALAGGCLLALYRPLLPATPRWAAWVTAAGLGWLALHGEGLDARMVAPLVTPALTLVLLTVATDGPVRALEAGWLRLVGRRSYALYLWHFPFLWGILPLISGPRWLWVPVLAAGAWGATLVSWRYIEEPILKLGRRPLGQTSATVTPAKLPPWLLAHIPSGVDVPGKPKAAAMLPFAEGNHMSCVEVNPL